jgi:hypothetical protein
MSNENTISINLHSYSDKDSISQGIEHFNSCLNGDWYKINDSTLEINPTDFATLLNLFLKDKMTEFEWHRLKRDVEKQLQILIDSQDGNVRNFEYALSSIRE